MRLLKQIKSALSLLVESSGLLQPGSGDSPVYRPWPDDKATMKARLREGGVPVPPTYAVISSDEEIAEAWETVRSLDGFVVKPTGGPGHGVLVLQRALDDGESYWRTPSGCRMSPAQIQRHISNLVARAASSSTSGRAMVEYRVTIDDIFYQIYPRGLTGIHVITSHGIPVHAMAHIPTDQSNGRAHPHQGALSAGINMTSGIMSAACDSVGHLAEHPDTYASIEGVKIKNWDAILDICTQAADALALDHLDVELVVDAEEGPMVMGITPTSDFERQTVATFGQRSVLHDI